MQGAEIVTGWLKQPFYTTPWVGCGTRDLGSGKGKVGKRSEPPHCLKQVVVVVGAEDPVSPNEHRRAEVVELNRYTQDFLGVSSLLKRVRCWRCGGLWASPLLETNSGGGGMSRMLLLTKWPSVVIIWIFVPDIRGDSLPVGSRKLLAGDRWCDIPFFSLCSMSGEKLLRTAKSGNDWSRNELLAFNIKIKDATTAAFFNIATLPATTVSQTILNNLTEPAGPLSKTDQNFLYTCRWLSLGPLKNRLSMILQSSSYPCWITIATAEFFIPGKRCLSTWPDSGLTPKQM